MCTGCGDATGGDDARGQSVASSHPPNIVLVISDDQDYEDFGFLGHPLNPTPSIDRLARAGAVFPVAYTQPRCRSALAVLLSGLEPHRSGIHTNVGPGPLRSPQLLPVLLRDAGYQTYAQGKFWEGDARELGFTHGRGEDREAFVREDKQAGVFAFLEAVGESPFFLWWAPMMPHTPHNPPPRLAARFDRASIPIPDYVSPSWQAEYEQLEGRSLAMVAWFDREVGRLVEKLRSLELLDDTLLVFLVDNGWALGLPSKASPYEKGVRTPLVIYAPGRIQPERHLALASTLDVMPTILDYAGVAIPESLDGMSLRPIMEGDDVPWRDRLFGACYTRVAQSDPPRPREDLLALQVRTRRWKYVQFFADVDKSNWENVMIRHDLAPFPARKEGDVELYDLNADPYELHNRAGEPSLELIESDLRRSLLDWWED